VFILVTAILSEQLRIKLSHETEGKTNMTQMALHQETKSLILVFCLDLVYLLDKTGFEKANSLVL